MQETQALNLLDIPRSTFKEWSNPTHKKHKLYLLLKHIDAKYAESCIAQKAPKRIMVILNRNIKQEEHFNDNEIFKLFSKKSYAKLTARERVAFAKIVRECEESDLNDLFNEGIVSKEIFLHLLGASPLAPFSALTVPHNTLAKIRHV
jgi:hypothetical protein